MRVRIPINPSSLSGAISVGRRFVYVYADPMVFRNADVSLYPKEYQLSRRIL
jgi:hypothetical protein